MLNSKYFTSKFIKTPSFGHSSNKVMIVMHGLGDQLESYEPFVKEINVTGIHYILINGPMEYPIGHSWYDLPPIDPRPSIDRSTGLLKKLIEELNLIGFSHEDIFVMGFSQGGAMAIELGQNIDKPLGGVIALSPRVYLDPQNLSENFKNTPFFSSHGLYDEVIAYEETKNSLEQMKPQVSDFFFSSHPMGHEISYEEIVELRSWLNEHI